MMKSENTGKLRSFGGRQQNKILTRWFKLTNLFKRMAKHLRTKLDSAPHKHLIDYSLAFFAAGASSCVHVVYTGSFGQFLQLLIVASLTSSTNLK